MALIQAEVDLANQSLGRIGAKQVTLASVTANTRPEDVQVNLNFEQTRDSLLRSFVWPFARVRLRLAGAWETDTSYNTDQYVWQEGLLYKCIVAHESDVFATDLSNLNWTLISNIDDWVTATAYIVGDLVTTNALLYKCLVAHTSGTFSTDLANGNWILTTQKPENTFGFSYDLPATSLRLFEVDGKSDVVWRKNNDFTWRLESNAILTDVDVVDIVYIDQITATTSWDSLFTEMFIIKLAMNLLNPLTGIGGSAQGLRTQLLTELRILNQQTRAIGRQEGRGNTQRISWNQTRFVSRGNNTRRTFEG